MSAIRTICWAPIILGLCAGLLVTGCAEKSTGSDNSALAMDSERPGETVAAIVSGTNIYRSDVENALKAKGTIVAQAPQMSDDVAFQSQLDELIDQRLLALDALRQSLDQDKDTKHRLAASRELILSNVVIEKLLAEKITDENLQRLYEEQSALRTDMKQVRARHILVESKEKALEIIELLDNGGDFANLAKQMTLDSSTRDLGGDLSFFSLGSMDEGIASQAFALKRGEVSPPFQTNRGWHVLKVEAVRMTPQPAFEDIKPEIVSFMTYDEIEKKLRSLRSESEIELKLGPKDNQGDIQSETNNGP